MWTQNEKPVRVIVSNVAGEVFANNLIIHTEKYWEIQPEFIMPRATAFGISNAYQDAGKLGADRWATLIAAHHAGHGATCIVDCGTAITIDAINAQGEHLGGLILPGLATMRSALAGNTHALPYTMDGVATNLVPLAQDTVKAITNGSLYAVVSAIDRIVADLCAQLEIESTIITGGDAEHLMPLLATQYQHEPQLVLQGLAIIARMTS